MRYLLGLMSGTSLDGIDAAVVKLSGEEKLKAELVYFMNNEFPPELKARVEKAMLPMHSGIDELCSLNFELGELFADIANDAIKNSGISNSDISGIGSHGQTIYHIGCAQNNLQSSTLQLGEPAVIAYKTSCPVISNFRSADMAAGGQGAPLVPYSEFVLFRSDDKNLAFVNIGGISNISVLPKGCTIEDVFAFDLGPGNIVINALCVHFYGEAFDQDGRHATNGCVNHELLKEMSNNPYFEKPAPKSTGREDFGNAYTENLLRKFPHISADDFIASATHFAAKNIVEQIKKFVLPLVSLDELIVSGGGSFNLALMSEIKSGLNSISVMTGDEYGINADAKEAVAFAILADACLRGECANVPNATGASKRVVLGTITRV